MRKSEQVGFMRQSIQAEKPAVLIRTGGGNAPSLMALRVLERINSKRQEQRLTPVYGVFPISSDRQVRMLQQEASDPGRVLIDRQYAEIVDPYVSTHGRLNDHISVVVNNSITTKRALMQRFGPTAEPFDGMSVGSGESVTIHPREIVGVLDAGSRYPSIDHPQHEFFFPVLASKLWHGLVKEQQSYTPLVQVDNSSLKNAIKNMKEVERGYDRIYLSLINSFSYRAISEGITDVNEQFGALQRQPKSHLRRPISYTPPMSPNTSSELPTDDVENPSIFVMFSGTGSSIAETNQLIPQIVAAGYDVIVPESALRFGDVTEENMPLVKIANSPTVIFHPNVHGVVARPGFGTLWDNENAGIESMRPPYTIGDDYEMVVNARTWDRFGLGEELQPGEIITPEDFRRARVAVYHRAQALKEKQIAQYGTKDGLTYVADSIAKRYSSQERQLSQTPVELNRDILRTDTYEFLHISPDGLTVETDKVLNWEQLAATFETNQQLSEKQLAYINRIMQRENDRLWKYAIRNIRRFGNTIKVDAGSQPFGSYESIGDPTDPEELVALASPHGNATILVTDDNKILVQYRKEWDEKTKTGNYFYGGMPGTSWGNLFNAPRGELESDGSNKGRPKPFGKAEIDADVRLNGRREIGIPEENITSVETLAVVADYLRIHTETTQLARTDLTHAQIKRLSQSQVKDGNGSTEEFFAIDATSDAIKVLVTELPIPLPPTHTAAFIAAGYKLRRNENLAKGMSDEIAVLEANLWLKIVQEGVRRNTNKINTKVRDYWKDKTFEQMRPSGGKEHRNTTGYDPGYSVVDNGLESIDVVLQRYKNKLGLAA